MRNWVDRQMILQIVWGNKSFRVILSHRIRLILIKLCWRSYGRYSVQYGKGNWYKLTLAALQVFLTSSMMSSTMMAILLLTSPTTYRGGRSYHHHAIQVSRTFLYSLSVLGIRDILVRIRIRTQLCIRLLSSVTLRMQKKFFSHFFSFLITHPQAHYLHLKN